MFPKWNLEFTLKMAMDGGWQQELTQKIQNFRRQEDVNLPLC